MSREPQPLWSWALAAALAVLVLAALALDPAGRATPAVDLNLARLDQAAADGAPLIVLIGSSKLQCAVAFDDEVTVQLKALGLAARVVRITRQGAVYADLQAAFERLQTLHPAVVVVEEDLLLFRHRQIVAPEAVSWRARAKRTVRARLGLQRIAFNAPETGRAPCGTTPPAPLSAEDMRKYLGGLTELHASGVVDRAPYLEQLARLRAGGATTVLLAAPRSPTGAAVFPDRLTRSLAPTLTSLTRDGGLARLAPNAAYPQSAFADAGHLNADGRTAFMAWLAPELVRLTRADHD